MRLVTQGKISVPVSRVFPLCDLAKAQGLMEERSIIGKVVVVED